MKKETKIDTIELARGYVGAILMFILMSTGVVSAMYAGESMSFETNLTNPVYTVTGNVSSLEGLNITFEDGNITIDTDPLMESDNFTLIFFDNSTREVEKIIYRGGGSGSTRYVDRNVTTYVPTYINNTEVVTNEVEVEKIVTQETEIATGFLILYILIAIVITMILTYLMVPKKRRPTLEEEANRS